MPMEVGHAFTPQAPNDALDTTRLLGISGDCQRRFWTKPMDFLICRERGNSVAKIMSSFEIWKSHGAFGYISAERYATTIPLQ
jgi:hypothetical protein